MRDKLNQFISNLNGQFVEVSDRTNIYQCMDLVYLWVFALDIPKATIQRLYASEVYTKANDLTKEYFDVIPYTPGAISQDGDIVVWRGEVGHIGLALGGGSLDSFMVFEQNNPLGTNAHVQLRSYANVLGWLRPKATVPTVGESIITDQTRIPQIGNKEVQKIRSMLIDQQEDYDNLFESYSSLLEKIPSEPTPSEPEGSGKSATLISQLIAWIVKKLGR